MKRGTKSSNFGDHPIVKDQAQAHTKKIQLMNQQAPQP